MNVDGMETLEFTSNFSFLTPEPLPKSAFALMYSSVSRKEGHTNIFFHFKQLNPFIANTSCIEMRTLALCRHARRALKVQFNSILCAPGSFRFSALECAIVSVQAI